MSGKTEVEKMKVLDGNGAAAHGVLLSRPDLVSVYPITPQTSLIEKLCQFKAEGLLDCEIVTVEGENSAMGAVIGTSAAGGRTFTATSSMGLDFMFDTYIIAAGLRLPVVMVNVNRDQQPPSGPVAGEQDIMHVRDAGWVQIHCENCQEILDSIFIAYRLAEDPDILLPVTVSYDGFYLSYLKEGIVVPTQGEVDRFLEPVKVSGRPVLREPGKDLILGAGAFLPDTWVEYRYKHQSALERVKQKIEAIDQEFYRSFGRPYGELIEEYRTEDAQIVLVSLGSHTGTARAVIDEKRKEGLSVGLVKVRFFRPFPREALAAALKGRKAIGVLDRSVCFGWNCGHLFMELKAVLNDLEERIPAADFIGGLGGGDITKEQIARAIDVIHGAAKGKSYNEVTWMSLE
ncbi:transketolase C-terminal domain-containing protein [Thermodesulfobacteriota bacterium]